MKLNIHVFLKILSPPKKNLSHFPGTDQKCLSKIYNFLKLIIDHINYLDVNWDNLRSVTNIHCGYTRNNYLKGLRIK